MSANTINYPGTEVAAHTPEHQGEAREAVPRQKRGSKDDVKPQTDGSRKNTAKSRSVALNIQEIPAENGVCSYRVQIRKTVRGQVANFTKTFSTLSMAKRWKERELAEIEINAMQTPRSSFRNYGADFLVHQVVGTRKLSDSLPID